MNSKDRQPAPLEVRFWRHVRRGDEADCWLWTGNKALVGYGVIRSDGEKKHTLYAHRVSWTLANGPIPAGLYVCHNCPGGDNRLCVNPSHLWVGTHLENIADAKAKGWKNSGDQNYVRRHPECLHRGDQHHAHRHPERLAHGEAHYAAKLTDDLVRAIRKLHRAGLKPTPIARQLGITRSLVRGVTHKNNWKHVVD